MNKKLKGFTLVELIVVVAIFGIIMAAALNLLLPVGKQFTSTAEFEGARSSVDNISRNIAGSLKYANRCTLVAGKDYYDSNGNIDMSKLETELNEFVKYYYDDNLDIDYSNESDKTIYILDFNNTTGMMNKYSTTVNNDGVSHTTVSNLGNPVNDALFNDYQFKYYLGSWDYTNDGSGTYKLNPQTNITSEMMVSDDVINISSFASNKMSLTIDIIKKYTNGTIKPLNQCSVVNCSLVNHDLGSTKKVWTTDAGGSEYIVTNASGNDVYASKNEDLSLFRKKSNEYTGQDLMYYDSFYIIYTLPSKY